MYSKTSDPTPIQPLVITSSTNFTNPTIVSNVTISQPTTIYVFAPLTIYGTSLTLFFCFVCVIVITYFALIDTVFLPSGSILTLSNAGSLEISGDLTVSNSTVTLTTLSSESPPPIVVTGCMELNTSTLEIPSSSRGQFTIAHGFNASCSTPFAQLHLNGPQSCVVATQALYVSFNVVISLGIDISSYLSEYYSGLMEGSTYF